MAMTGAEISALAALAGSALGGVTPIISNHVVQRSLMRREMLGREFEERQNLYAEFIRFGAKVYAEARTSNLEKLDDLVLLYSYVSRIRLLASDAVIQAAEDFANLVTRRYGETNLTLEGLREAALETHVDPLNQFSSCCRGEIRMLLRRGRRD